MITPLIIQLEAWEKEFLVVIIAKFIKFTSTILSRLTDREFNSTDNPARRFGEEIFEHGQFALGFGAFQNVGFGFFKRNAAVVDGFVHIFHAGDLFGGETVAAHAFAV